jgi:hypothetical protein
MSKLYSLLAILSLCVWTVGCAPEATPPAEPAAPETDTDMGDAVEAWDETPSEAGSAVNEADAPADEAADAPADDDAPAEESDDSEE